MYFLGREFHKVRVVKKRRPIAPTLSHRFHEGRDLLAGLLSLTIGHQQIQCYLMSPATPPFRILEIIISMLNWMWKSTNNHCNDFILNM